jgi:nucleotide-binding universal stress UspA family protein
MMKRILVPLDGSALAERALAVAAKLARANGGQLILVQALATTIEYGSPFVPDMVPLAIVDKEPEAQVYLTRLTELPMLSGLPVKTCILADVPALAILNAVTEHQADTIVMTSHGRTGVSRWVFGSVAEHVARQSHLPVLVLRPQQVPFWTEGADLVEPPQTPAADRQPLPQLRVLVPLDGSPLAEAVLEPAAVCALSLAQGVEQSTRVPRGSIGAEMHLLLVVRPFDAMLDNVPESLVVTGAQKYLRQVAERVGRAHPEVHVTWQVATAGDIAGYLVALLQEEQSAGGEPISTSAGETPVTDDSGRHAPNQAAKPSGAPYSLLAMATHGRTGVVRWVWGSITERVVHKTQLPLLLVRPAWPVEQSEVVRP